MEGSQVQVANNGATPLCTPLNSALSSQELGSDESHRFTDERGQRLQRFKSRIVSTCTWPLIRALLLGQVLSLLICGTGVTSQVLRSDYGVDAPTAQSFLNYVLLCVVFTSTLAFRRGDRGLWPVLKKRGWKYVLVAACDVEANYLLVKAYQYTTLTSVQLLDCFTIVVVMGLSFAALRVRYRWQHMLAVGVCLLGVGSLVWADVVEEKPQGADASVVGDLLVLGGAALYGLSNVAEEVAVRNYSVAEFLGMVGLFGCVINGIQLAVLERQELAKIDWDNWAVILLMVGFACFLFSLYVLMPWVIKATSATVVNLSILSADVYSLLFGLFLFHYHFNTLYFVSFALILLGIFLYSMYPTREAPETSNTYRVMENDQTADGQEVEMTASNVA